MTVQQLEQQHQHATEQQQLLHEAARLHKLNDLSGAERACRQVLAAAASHAGGSASGSQQQQQQQVQAAALAQLAVIIAQQQGSTTTTTKDGGGGWRDEAIALAKRAVQLAPSDARCRRALGLALEAAGRPGEAADAYARAAEKAAAARHAPAAARAWVDAARVLKAQPNKLAAAADALRAAIEQQPDHPSAHLKLAGALRKLGRHAAAADAYRQHLRVAPGHEAAAFWLAALTGATASGGGAADADAAIERQAAAIAAAACPPKMVATLFDQYADNFDAHLVQQLGYKTPEVLLACLQEVADATAAAAAGSAAAAPPGGGGEADGRPGRRRWQRAADLGCGTGLMGPLLRPLAARLDGVDLSGGMAARARARGCYDSVDVGELVAWLRSQAAAAAAGAAAGGRVGGGDGEAAASATALSFDLLVAADVLVYVGALSPVLAAAAEAACRGALFALSTELLPEEEQGGGGGAGSSSRGFVLQATGRFAHAAAYIQREAAAAGWAVRLLRPATIRHNAGQAIIGNLVVLERL